MGPTLHLHSGSSGVNMNYTATATTWDIGATIVTAFEAGGLSLALIIFLVWVIRIISQTIITRRSAVNNNEC